MTMTRLSVLLRAIGIILVLGGLGHTLGVVQFYAVHGVPDPNRVLLDIWIAEAQFLGGGLYLAAASALRSNKEWRRLALFGALTMIGFSVPMIPVVFHRARVVLSIPPSIYLLVSLIVLSIALRNESMPASTVQQL